MSNEVDQLVDALMVRVRDEIQAVMPKFPVGTYMGAEADNPDLSIVLIEGVEYRNVGKMVGTTALTPGKTVQCMAVPSMPMLIMDVPIR